MTSLHSFVNEYIGHLHLCHNTLKFTSILPHKGLVKIKNDRDREQNSSSTADGACVINERRATVSD